MTGNLARNEWMTVLLAVSGLALGACGSDGDPGGATTAPDRPAAGAMTPCAQPGGVTIGVPEGWEANPGERAARCSLFHPGPFSVPEASDERARRSPPASIRCPSPASPRHGRTARPSVP
jgi:hypothetical protein